MPQDTDHCLYSVLSRALHEIALISSFFRRTEKKVLRRDTVTSFRGLAVAKTRLTVAMKSRAQEVNLQVNRQAFDTMQRCSIVQLEL